MACVSRGSSMGLPTPRAPAQPPGTSQGAGSGVKSIVPAAEVHNGHAKALFSFPNKIHSPAVWIESGLHGVLEGSRRKGQVFSSASDNAKPALENKLEQEERDKVPTRAQDRPPVCASRPRSSFVSSRLAYAQHPDSFKQGSSSLSIPSCALDVIKLGKQDKPG